MKMEQITQALHFRQTLAFMLSAVENRKDVISLAAEQDLALLCLEKTKKEKEQRNELIILEAFTITKVKEHEN